MTEQNILNCLGVICAQLRLGRSDALSEGGVMSPDTEALFRFVLAEMSDERGPMCVLDVCRSLKFGVKPGDIWERYGHTSPAVVRAPEEFRRRHRLMVSEIERRSTLSAAAHPPIGAGRTKALVEKLAEEAGTGMRHPNGGLMPALSNGKGME